MYKAKPSQNYLRSYRLQESIKVPPKTIRNFNLLFPGIFLIPTPRWAADLISFRETKELFRNHRELVLLGPRGLARMLVAGREDLVKTSPEFQPKRLEYTMRSDGKVGLRLVLDDPEGDLLAERDSYSDAIYDLIGERLPADKYVPALGLGYFKKVKAVEDLDTAPLATLHPHLGGKIKLSYTNFDPPPFMFPDSLTR